VSVAEPSPEARRVCRAYRMRSEVKVLTWGPDRGNPTSRRQGRGPEFTGRLADGWLCWRASVRAGLKEAIDALWLRTRVKRHKVPRVGELARGSDARFVSVPRADWRRDLGDV
jgi:hypothetical protein